MKLTQVLVVVAWALSLVSNFMYHGQEYVKEYNFPREAAKVLFWASVLKIGGFF